MRCPRCLSKEVSSSRRISWERLVLPILRAHVYRCRDCKHRFRVGVEMGGIILGTVLAVTAFVIAAIVLVENQQEDRTFDSKRSSSFVPLSVSSSFGLSLNPK